MVRFSQDDRLKWIFVAAFIGCAATGVAFRWGTALRHLAPLVLPGTIAYLVIGGGMSGGTEIAQTVGLISAFVVNAIVYALVALLIRAVWKRYAY